MLEIHVYRGTGVDGKTKCSFLDIALRKRNGFACGNNRYVTLCSYICTEMQSIHRQIFYIFSLSEFDK